MEYSFITFCLLYVYQLFHVCFEVGSIQISTVFRLAGRDRVESQNYKVGGGKNLHTIS